MKLFLEYGADVNLKNQSGMTPLHIATYNGKFAIAKFLLENHADPNAKDHCNRVPVTYAFSERRSRLLIPLFQKHLHLDEEGKELLQKQRYRCHFVREII